MLTSYLDLSNVLERKKRDSILLGFFVISVVVVIHSNACT